MAINNWKAVPFAVSDFQETDITMDITSPGFGTPEIVILMLAGAMGEDSDDQFGHMHIGFVTDGKGLASGQIRDQDALSTMRTSRCASDSLCIRLAPSLATSDVTQIGFDSFITDGVRLQVDTHNGAFWHGTAILIRGNIKNVDVSSYNLGTSTAEQSVNVGFQPHFLMGFDLGANNANVRAGDANMCIGLACEDYEDALKQKCFSFHSDNGTSSASTESYIRSPVFLSQNTVASNILYSLVVNSFEPTGWKWQADSSSGNDIAYVLAIEFDVKPEMDFRNFDVPTSGDLDIVQNIEPQPGAFNYLVCGWWANYNTVTTHTSVTQAMWSTGDPGDEIRCHEQAIRHGTGTADVVARLETSNLKMYDPNITGVQQELICDGRTDNVDGYTFSVATNPAALKRGYYFVLSDAPASGPANMFFGSTGPDDMKLGTLQVDALYQGSNQLW